MKRNFFWKWFTKICISHPSFPFPLPRDGPSVPADEGKRKSRVGMGEKKELISCRCCFSIFGKERFAHKMQELPSSSDRSTLGENDGKNTFFPTPHVL